MLHIFVGSSKRKKFSGDELHGKPRIIKWVSPLKVKKVREGKKKLNEEVRLESERIRKCRFLTTCTLNVYNLPQ